MEQINFPFLGNSLVMAITILVHVFLAFVAVGGLAALTAFTFGGYTRERARKPYLIYGYMYMNQAYGAEAAKLKTAAVNVGDVLDKHGCLACHKFGGKGGTFGPALDEHLKEHTKDDLKKLLRKPPTGMPPFSGSDQELSDFVDSIKK